jgi:C-terminal processing protease CtpA/Prc
MLRRISRSESDSDSPTTTITTLTVIAKRSLFALAKALEGLPVLGALEGTPAARAGVRYGDILLSVNGIRTRTVSDYVEAKALRVEGMEIVVFRSGEERMATLTYDASPKRIDTAAILAELVTLRLGGDAALEDGDGSGETS